MKYRLFCLGLLVIALVLASCSMPQSPTELAAPPEPTEGGGSAPGGAVGVNPEQTSALITVETDLSRNQGIYINEKAQRIDIRAVEYDGSVVNCVKAVDVAVVSSVEKGEGATDTQVKAIVIGVRGDGQPGVWVIYNDDSIHVVQNEESGLLSSMLPESYDGDEGFRGRFGWVYYVTAISEDGRIIVGYAKNEKGFQHGKWSIEPGTTVGVYWKARQKPGGPVIIVSRARVIGTLMPPKKPPRNPRWEHVLDRRMRKVLDNLKLFFLRWMKSYLTMTDSVHYDAVRDVYLVHGTDQDGVEAIATIDRHGRITIEPVEPPGQEIDLAPGAITFAAKYVADGQSLALTIPISNLAAGTLTDSFQLNFYLSQSSSLSPDADLGTLDVADDVPGNSTITVTATRTIPELEINRDVYIYAVVDPLGLIAETNETNNQSTVNTAGCMLVYDDENPSRSYDMVFETFPPAGSGGGTNTILALYKDVSGVGKWQADDDDGNPSYFLYSLIDSAGTGLLTPGSYYVLVRAYSPGGPYALSVRTANAARRLFPADLSSDPYPPDDNPQPAPFSTADLANLPPVAVDMAVGSSANRYAGSPDWDWFKVVLP